MNEREFRELIGKDLVVEYPFHGEIQKWSMLNFEVVNNEVVHKRLPLRVDVFIRNARNPHKGVATHG